MQAQQDAQTQFAQYQTRADHALGLKDATEQGEAVQDVLTHLDGLVKSYPDADVAPQALLLAAQLLNATNQPPKAAGYYERLVEMSSAPEGMKTLARRGQAEALEESGDVAGALALYQALAAAASAPQDAVEADWDVGRCCELLKDPENAKSFYQKAIAANSESKWAELARFRIESLGRGPMSPESAASLPATTGAAPAKTASTPASTMFTPSSAASMPPPTAPAATATTPAAAGETAPQ
jgi:tetratricopeptide (TPR) repeat protein